MYSLIKVVKFNDKYFEEGEVVEVTTTDKGNIIGSILIDNGEYDSTCDYRLCLDTSEKFHRNYTLITKCNIVDIKKVNC